MPQIANITMTTCHPSHGVEENSRCFDSKFDELKADVRRVVQTYCDSTMSPSDHVCVLFDTSEHRVASAYNPSDACDVDKAEQVEEEMRQAIRDGVQKNAPMKIPDSFETLSEKYKKDVVSRTVNWVLFTINRDTGKWMGCLVGNESIRKYLKDTVTEGAKAEIAKVGTLDDVLEAIEKFEMLMP